MGNRRRALRSLTPGHVQLESVEHWRSECADHRTPEALIIAHEEYLEAQARNARHSAIVAGLPQHQALALTFALGLFGQRAHTIAEVSSFLGTTEEEVAALVAIARQRVEPGVAA